MNDGGAARVSAGAISARIDRLPATRTIWTIVVLLGFGMFFELYDLLFSAYVAPSLVKSGVLTAATAGLFGTTGVASFIAALFTGLFIGTILCGFLADRFGRRAIFTASLIWYAIATLAMALDLCTTYGEGFLIANNNTLQRLLFNPGAPYAMLARHLWVHIIIAGNPMTGLNDCKWVKSDDGQSGTDFKTGVIYFAASHENGPQHYEVPVSTFCFPLSALPANPADRTARMGSEMRNAYYANDEILELWQVVKETIAEEAGKTVKVPWNLWLDVGRHIRTALSRFEEKSVKTNKREAERLFNLNGKTPMELVLQRAERDNLLHVLDQGGWKVQPELRAAVEGAIQQYHAARAPLYPLPDIQRLGYLDEQDTIVCKADLTLYRETKPHTIKTEDGYHTILDGDGEEMSGFDDIKEARAELKKLNTALPPPVQLTYRAGQKYSLRTQTVQSTRKTMKPNSFNGELEELEFTGQELAIFIADKVRDPDNEKEELTEYCFMDGKLRDDNTTIAEARQQKNRRRRRWEREPDAVPIDFTLQELADHFIIPDVPDVAANNPEGYQANLDKLNDVEQLANALIA